ncbi:kinesin-like protein Klp61F [Xylocopa sonorina]|uniref:kinesin-like protein Klp61F n=1 Tax=Xylocopa sonorina TaxID=1818115 RepID=UPI00403ACE51
MNMTDTRISRKEKYQHVKVFVRVRPISDAEVRNKSKNIIEINNSKEVTVRECLNDRLSKKFKFDNVFGPSSRQVDIYNTVVGSLMEQILSGYNCTILAYGQTGTGKTFTMEGINTGSNLYWQSDSSAGIIPRSLSHLFDKLQLSEVQEYTVRVSFLEIYNEELFDLLSVNDDGLKIKLYEDTSRKGAIIIQGLEEVIIHNISEVYKVLQRGLQRRQIATTLINAQSSRSHTVFSITVHMKETTVGGDDVLKTGKLNLVDLAGSENVGRSGAADRRVKEAGSINQSLLTLSRVITALVEKAPHIPYRESKLTRLLQESLGGRAKTSIIATISPASINIGETLSTLDYAHRARNITNRPEINQKLSKKEFRKQYLEEIERLQRDLLATRHKIGVYLADENYKEIQELISQQVKEIEEKNNHIKALETIMQNKEKIFNDIKMKSIAREKELYEIKIKLNSVESALLSTNNKLQQTVQELNKQKYLVEQYKNTEQSLLSQATALLSIADTAIEDSYKLHDKIAHKTEIERILENLGEEFKSNVSEYLQSVENDVSTCGERLKQFCTSIKNELVIATSVGCKNIDTALQQISSSLSAQYLSDTNNNLTNYINETVNYQSWIQNEMRNTVDAMECDQEYVNAISQTLSQHINDIIDNQFAKILQTIRNDVSQNLKQTSTLIDKIIDSACSYQFETYNHVTKNIEVIMKDVETVCEKQVLSEKQRLLTKIMADAFSQYNDLSKSLEDHHCTVINKCDSLNKICNTINDQTVNNCNVSVKINDLQEELQRSIKQTENDVIVRTNQNKEVANKITEEGKHIMSTLQSNINKSHNAFEQYKNTVERNIKEFQPQVDTDNNKALSLITNLARKVMLGANKDQEEFIADIKIKISDTLQEISAVLDNQVVESCAWSNNAIKQLRTAEAEINKFFNEDLQYDIPTGSTPVRKEFSYPRQFAVTSPHDRLLQRFRKSRKLIEAAAEYVLISNYANMYRTLSSLIQ